MSIIIGNPDTWFFQNPHPPLKKGDRVRLNYSAVDSAGHEVAQTPGTVLAYFCTSPRVGDQYHVQLDGHSAPITIPLGHMELIPPGEDDGGAGECDTCGLR